MIGEPRRRIAEKRMACGGQRTNRALAIVQREQSGRPPCCVVSKFPLLFDQRDAVETSGCGERVGGAHTTDAPTNDDDMLRTTTAAAHDLEDRTRTARPPRWSGEVVGLCFVIALVVTGCADDRFVEGDDTVVAAEGDPEASTLCDPELVDSTFGSTVVIYQVDDGQLGSVCFGEPLAVVEESWLSLSEIAPPGQLEPLDLFAGYEATGSGDTVAFAAPLPTSGDGDAEDELGSGFVIAVDLAASEADDQELLVTMAHEISHVFTQSSSELDRSVDPSECATFYNGLGCFTDDAFLTAWINQFWTVDELASLPADGSTDDAGGDERCAIDASYIGSYGASHPEEDFAESFAAYVFDIEVTAEAQPRIDFFEQYPELVAFRDRAAAANLDQLSYTFDRCG